MRRVGFRHRRPRPKGDCALLPQDDRPHAESRWSLLLRPVPSPILGRLRRVWAALRGSLHDADLTGAEEETRRRAAYFEALNAVISAAISVGDPPALLQATIGRALDALGCEQGAIWIGDTYDLRGVTVDLFASLLADPRTVCAVEDWQSRAPVGAEPMASAMLRAGVRASLQAPILAAGLPIGAIAALSAAPRTWSSHDLRLVEAIGTQIGGLAHRLQLLEATRQRTSELETFYDLSHRLRQARTVEQMYPIIVEHACGLLIADHGALALAAPDRQSFTVAHTQGVALEEPGLVFSAAQSPSGGVLKTGLTFVTRDFSSEVPHLGSDYPAYHASGPLIIVPVRSDEKITGTLRVARWNRPGVRAFTDAEVRLLEGIAEIAGTAIRRARLHDRLEQSYIEMVLALAKVTAARESYTGDHDERLATRAVALARAMGCSDAEAQDIHWGGLFRDIGKLGVPDSILRKPGALTDREWQIVRQHPAIGAEILNPVERMRDVALLVRHHHERWDGSGYPDRLAGDAIPLGARILAVVDAYSAMTDDRVHRVYGTQRTTDESLTELRRCAGVQFDPDVVEAFCRLVGDGGSDAAVSAEDGVPRASDPQAPATDIARSLSYGQRAGRAVPAMTEVTRRLLRPLDLTEVLDEILHHIQEVFGYPICCVFFVDEQAQALYVKAQRGYDPQVARVTRLRVGQAGIVGWVADKRRSYYAADVARDPLYVSISPVTRSEAAFPLIVDDRVIGVLNVESPTVDAFPKESREFLEAFAVLAGLAILRAQRDEDLSRLALTDGLTGLANHRALWEALEREIARARRNGRPVSVVMVEIDGFKRFNDRFGHLEGDLVLQAVADALRSNSRAMDLVTRFGGDEFVVLLPDAPHDISAQIAERVRARVEQIRASGAMGVTVSVGVATMHKDGDTAKALIATADQRMYEVKRAGGNRVGAG
ncbi:MAG TPA: diguanylate cyclase [bacterium]|nr:diguanylate cyclase [bacterium]